MRYSKNEKMKLRPVNGSEGCMVSVPDIPGIRMLNTSAWFILESCNNSNLAEIIQAYEAATQQGNQGELVHACLLSLESGGMIHVAND